MKKIICDYFLFIAILSMLIMGCVGCGDKKNQETEKGCYGEVIRYDITRNSSTTKREILIKGESDSRMLFTIIDNQINENLKEIYTTKVGDMVSVVYITSNNIVDYKIVG